MKEIKKEDLKDGEVYVAINSQNNRYVFKKTNNLKKCYNISHYNIFHVKTGNFNTIIKTFLETTPEEKHWLETCIKANKFISYEDAMKSFEPEFVLPEKWCLFTSENVDILNKYLVDNKANYKNYNINWNIHSGLYFHSESHGAGGHSSNHIYKGFTEITFEQFEKYVLNKNSHNFKVGDKIKSVKWPERADSVEIIKIEDDVLFFKYNNGHFSNQTRILAKNAVKFKEIMETPKDKVLAYDSMDLVIIRVECAEGGIYNIDDKITVFTKDSPNKGKIFTIKSFRWNNAKTNLCAITELHTPNGIGLDKIQLYIEPKKELSLLEQAKLKYPVGTRFKGFNAATNELSDIMGMSKGDFNYGTVRGDHMECIRATQGFCYTPKRGWAEIVK
jgi:hypothetical protein